MPPRRSSQSQASQLVRVSLLRGQAVATTRRARFSAWSSAATGSSSAKSPTRRRCRSCRTSRSGCCRSRSSTPMSGSRTSGWRVRATSTGASNMPKRSTWWAMHTNTIEGFWSLVNRGITETHHAVSAKWLQVYLNEYAWALRPPRRRAGDVPDATSAIGDDRPVLTVAWRPSFGRRRPPYALAPDLVSCRCLLRGFVTL